MGNSLDSRDISGKYTVDRLIALRGAGGKQPEEIRKSNTAQMVHGAIISKRKCREGKKSYYKANVNPSRGRRVGFQSISSTSSHLGLKREWGVGGFVGSGDEHENRFPLMAPPASVNTYDSCIAGGWKTDVIERG